MVFLAEWNEIMHDVKTSGNGDRVPNFKESGHVVNEGDATDDSHDSPRQP